MVTAAAELISIDEFLALPDSDDYELIDGVLRPRWADTYEMLKDGVRQERRVSLDAVWTAGELHGALWNFNQVAKVGVLFGDGAPVTIFADRPRYAPRPDGLFISHARFGARALQQPTLTVPPELIIEVVSPNDAATAVEGKIQAYLGAGVDTVWVAYPEHRTVHVFRRAGQFEVLRDGDTLRGDGPLTGLEIPVTSVFPARETAG